MTIAKRIFFFLVVNMLVMAMVSVVSGLICYFLYGQMTPPEGSLIPIIIWAGLWGMGGSVCLALPV